MDNSMDRREFLGGAAGVVRGSSRSCCELHVLAGAAGQRPSDKLNIAAIGIGGMGGSNVKRVPRRELRRPVRRRRRVCRQGVRPSSRTPRSTRTSASMLDKEDKNIDASSSRRPDHTHAVIAHGRHPARQARLPAEAAGPLDLRGAASSPRPPARPRCRPRWATRAIPPTRFACCASGSRTGPSARCARSTPGATGRWAAIRGRISRSWPGRRRRRRCPRRSTGTCGWARPVSALSPGLRPHAVAGLVGFRHRRPRRHGLPHPRPGLLGAQARPADAGRGHDHALSAGSGESETYPRASIVRYEFPPRRYASREADLERRPADAAATEGSGARPPTGRQRHLAHRREEARSCTARTAPAACGSSRKRR